MEVGFSVKAQALSALNCAPISSSFAASGVRSLRKEFLGSAHSLRPPGLRSRRKCKKLEFRFRVHSPNFVLKASLDSQSALVAVAVVTVSALTAVVYRNYSKRKMNVKEMSQQLSVALSEQIRSIVKGSIFCQFLIPSETEEEASVSEKESLVKDSNYDSHNSGDALYAVKLNETVSGHGETSVSTVFEYPRINLVASSSNSSLSSSKFETTGSLSVSSVLPESDVRPINFSLEASGVQLDECMQETAVRTNSSLQLIKTGPNANSSDAICMQSRADELIGASHGHVEGTNSSMQLIKTRPNANSSDVIYIQSGADELVAASHGHVEGDATSSFSFTRTDSSRKELHTFYEASTTNLYSVETTSNASVQGTRAFPPAVNGLMIVGREISAADNLYPAENFTGKGPRQCHQESFFPKKRDSWKRKDLSIHKEENNSHHNGSNTKFPYPIQKAEHGNRHRRLRKFSAYNQFLKEGRLIECIEMLEDLERKGLLDMDKVYHAGFLKVCKTRRAVNEAFRFTRLIPNPTLSTFNMLMSVCASAQETDRAFQVLQLLREAGLVADCKLYTTLISTCAKCGKVDMMFEVFHEMVNAGVEPNVHTYGAVIDGCGKAGQVAKAFGAYGILRSKNVKPDRVVFNALITACGQSGAVDRAFDVLAEMRSEIQPIDPDHVTVGALIKACANAGQVDRAKDIYKMLGEYNIKGTPEVYTIAINSCSQNGDWEFACSVHNDMIGKGISPDEMLISSLIDVAGHAGKVDSAFEILEDAKNKGIPVGVIAYSSLMGACCNSRSWEKALSLYDDIKLMNFKPTVSLMNALITALCDADKLQMATEALHEMKRLSLCPNTITYSVLLVATEKEDDLETGLMLLSQAKKDRVIPNLVMCRCLIAMCLRRFQKACALGEPVSSFKLGRPQLDSKWTSLALRVYREAILSGVVPSAEELSQVLACLRFPHDGLLRKSIIENLGLTTNRRKSSNLCSLVDGFGEYDPRAFSLLEEAASRGIIPVTSFQESPIVIDVRNMQIGMAEVYILIVIRGLKHRLAAGAKLPNITILLPIEQTQVQTPSRAKTLNLSGRTTQAVAALLRRLGLPYQGNESYGKVRIFGVALKKWLQPKLDSPFSGGPTYLSTSQTRLGKEISHQQRNIRTGNLSYY